MIRTIRWLLVLIVSALGAALPAAATEEPEFALVQKDGRFELRDYAPVILAETTLAGSAERTRNAGFMPLADYIFAKDRPGEQIAMTAPVGQRPAAGNWTISFTMPANYTLETLPAPASADVRLVSQPARRMAVLRFSGNASASDMEMRRRELFERVAAADLRTIGTPVFAFYDPPWTLPFMRRNEVMIEVAAR